MSDISKIDSNFKAAIVGDKEIVYYNAVEKPFVFEGLAWRGEKFFRLPAHFTTAEVNEGALMLSNHTAGCAVRFKCSSSRIAIRAKLAFGYDTDHMPRCGSCGFDLYRRNDAGKMVFCKAIQPHRDEVDLERLVLNDGEAGCGMVEYLLNFPIYSGVEHIEIGVAPDSEFEAPAPHKIDKPILFYGSSITQGGCASRPGNAYTSMLCRKLDAEQYNLGFAGCGRGEIAVAQAIAELDLGCVVLDYDHNAPTAEHLRNTHEIFFRTIRQKNPELPILLISKCDFYDSMEDRERRKVIQTTWQNALAAGDRNVAYIDGELLWGDEDRDACSVDRCHPNDLGFYRMSQVIYPVLKELLNRR